MTFKEKQKTVDLLNQFFDEYDINERDFLCKNIVAKVLKAKLKAVGRWKNLGRGNGGNPDFKGMDK